MKPFLCAMLAALFQPAEAAQARDLAGEIDLFEMHFGSGDDHFVFDGEVRAGEGRHGATFTLNGGSDVGAHIDEVVVEAFYSFRPRENAAVLAGVRHDFREGRDLTLGVVGAKAGLGDMLSVEHFLLVSERGDVTGEAMALGALPLTPRLTLEPRAELFWSAQRVPDEQLGSGVTDVTLSVRLRRSLGPAANVYVGAIHERLVGDTRRIAQAGGDRGQVNRAVIGAGFAF